MQGESGCILDALIKKYPALDECKSDIQKAFNALIKSYSNGGKALLCGNGGSAADCGHVVGELMKGFLKKRKLNGSLAEILKLKNDDMGNYLMHRLQGALPAIDLTAQSPIFTAFCNDVDAELVFAQQVLGYGKACDVLIGFSTSGNSKNVVYALYLAQKLGMITIGFDGQRIGKMDEFCDITIKVPAVSTPDIQELHLPVYHALCAMVESYFFVE